MQRVGLLGGFFLFGLPLLGLSLLALPVAEAKKKAKKPAPTVAKPVANSAANTSPSSSSAKANSDKTPELGPPPTQETAIQLYQDAQFAQSIVILDRLAHGELNDRDRLQVKLYLGLNFLAVGNQVRATAVFQELLDLDPDFELPAFSSPSVRSFFANIKRTYKIIPSLSHNPPPQIDAAQGAKLEVELKRMRPGYQASLFYRPHGAAFFSRVELSQTHEQSYVAMVPSAMLLKDKLKDSSYALEYFFVVSEGKDNVLVQLRSPESPFSVPVSIPIEFRKPPVYKTAWFWATVVTVAGVVAGGTVAAILLTKSSTPPTGNAHVSFSF